MIAKRDFVCCKYQSSVRLKSNLDCLWIISQCFFFILFILYFSWGTYSDFLQRACTFLFHFTPCLWIFSNMFLKVLAVFQELLNVFFFWKNILFFFLGFKLKCLWLILQFLFPVIKFIRLWTERDKKNGFLVVMLKKSMPCGRHLFVSSFWTSCRE